jgi:nitrous oxidase accessory protein NosD
MTLHKRPRSTERHMTSAARRVLAALVATLATAMVAAPATAAPPATVTCGQTVTASVRLANDLIDCPGSGIVIGADNIDVDLNGHAIDGDGVLGCAEFYACDYGIDNTAGHRGVTIEDGSIREFATAIFVLGASDNRIRDLSSSDNLLGGMLLIGSARSHIQRTSISHNGLTTDQAGLIVFDSTDVQIEGNSVLANGDIGMFLIGLDSSQIERNSLRGNPEAGVVLDGSANDLSRNHVTDGEGIIVTGDDNHVTANNIADTTHCDDGGCGHGISLEGGTGNAIERNTMQRTAEAGIRLAAFEPDTPPAVDNVVRSNTITDSATDGILVEATATGTLVEHNVTSANADDGIEIDNPTTTLTRNTADDNGDLGIEAIAGVFDGGHNRAASNNNPAQCSNVACS